LEESRNRPPIVPSHPIVIDEREGLISEDQEESGGRESALPPGKRGQTDGREEGKDNRDPRLVAEPRAARH
jgi:hypothetical protein